jgi:hypothetical protein
MATWQEFASVRPELAAHGKRMLQLGRDHGDFEGGLGYLATVSKAGSPRVHPISPVLVDGQLYAFVLRRSPKRTDLLDNGRYALHSFPYPLSEQWTDAEFYLAGRARLVDDPSIRQAVADGCGDDVTSGDVFALDIERVMQKGRPDGVLIYTTWVASGSG